MWNEGERDGVNGSIVIPNPNFQFSTWPSNVRSDIPACVPCIGCRVDGCFSVAVDGGSGELFQESVVVVACQLILLVNAVEDTYAGESLFP